MKKSASLLGAILLASVSVLSYAQAPVPFINLPLVPDAMPPGGSDFTLTVNGTGFGSNSVVNWNGSCSGFPPVPAVTLSPTNLTFGTHLVGTSSAPQSVTLTNTGNAPLDIQSILASRNFSH